MNGFLNVVGESTDEWKGRKCKGGLDSKVKPSLHFESLDCFEKKHSLCWVASCGGMNIVHCLILDYIYMFDVWEVERLEALQ